MDMLLGIYHIPGAIFWHMVFYDKNSKVPEWIQTTLNQIVNLLFWGSILLVIGFLLNL